MATYSSTSSTSTGTSQLYSDQGTGATTEAGAVSIDNRYTDLNLQMIPHPQKLDIIPLKGELAVKNAVKNLMLTQFYERPFNSTLGANLRSLLFEPSDTITKLAIEDGVKNVLENHEPRIDNVNVVVNSFQEDTEYRITVIFSIKASDEISEVEINLRRLR